MMVVRDITRSTDLRTAMFTLLPSLYGLGHTAAVIYVGGTSS